MRIIGSQRGAISLGSLIFLLVLGTGIYIAVKMAVPLIRNYQVQELFKNEVIRLKTVSEEDVRNNINKKLDEIEVKLSEESFSIIREDGKPPRIEARFNIDVDFAGLYKYTYTFHPVGEAPKGAGYN